MTKHRQRRWLLWPVTCLCALVLLLPAATLGMFRFINPPTTAFMWRVSHNQAVKAKGGIHQRWIGLDQIARCMPLAVVAGEDQTFPTNYGFAWHAIQQAAIHDLHGGHLRGASTITQQTAKNLFLWPARSLLRKAIEAYITVWMVALWPKRRVMSVYLNTVQFDNRVFGVSAAARHLFSVPASDLSRSQCALLAAVLPNPTGDNAAHPDTSVRRHAHWILGQMHNLGPHYLDNVLGPR